MKKLNEPNIQKVEEKRPYVSIPIEVTLKEWNKATALVGKVLAWTAKKKVDIAGAPFFKYRVIGDMDRKFSIEVGVPVSNVVEGDGRVIAGFIPAGSYVSLVHDGHPDQIRASHQAVEDWANQQGLEWDISKDKDEKEVWGGRFEFYLSNPVEQPDPNKWSTLLQYRLHEKCYMV